MDLNDVKVILSKKYYKLKNNDVKTKILINNFTHSSLFIKFCKQIVITHVIERALTVLFLVSISLNSSYFVPRSRSVSINAVN